MRINDGDNCYVEEILEDLNVEAAMSRHLTSNRWEVTGSYTGYSTRLRPSKVWASRARKGPMLSLSLTVREVCGSVIGTGSELLTSGKVMAKVVANR